MHILFCVNKAKLRTKCFVKVEHFVLPFINIEVKKVSEGAVTNVLPQKINAGEEIGTITIGGVVQKISAVEDLDLKAGSTLSVRLSRRIGGGIIDGNVPLYR